ncbi:ankyrin repeat domain protein [Nitzschia inconspicua]|uniref:Ankyrin repeat domain protein n=1 Tax=Nitzschia inconspicua TaxID=303405 RepID=A0A9K3PZT0_9STRA|nr:ankyrin repeat domain protein [Nitzschia inconspicua]
MEEQDPRNDHSEGILSVVTIPEMEDSMVAEGFNDDNSNDTPTAVSTTPVSQTQTASVSTAAAAAAATSPMCSSQQPTPLAASTSSLHRATTPTYFSPSDRIVDAWIQQSLTMPSATGGGQPDESYRIDAGMPAPRHRRDRSVGSGFSATDYASLYGITTITPRGTSTGGRFISTSSAHSGTSEFHNSWSTNSTPNVSKSTVHLSEQDVMNVSTPSLLTASSSHGDRPLSLSRVSSSADEDGIMGTGVSSVIHDAARITSWQTVIELCETQPEAAAYIGRDGWTALHHACNRRCPVPEAVEALIRAYPDALLVEEDKGWLPLHYACRFKAPKEAVRLLLRMYPEKGRFGVSRPDRKGRTPLWYAVRYDAPTGVPSLLLEVDPSTVLEEDQNSNAPLAVVWDQFAEKMDGKRTLNRIIGTGMDNDGSNFHCTLTTETTVETTETLLNDLNPMEKAELVKRRLESQKVWCKRWSTVNSFLRAAFGFTMDDDWELVDTNSEEEKKDSPVSQRGKQRKFRILHAVSAIRCHHSLFLLAAALHPEQAFEVDDNDLRRMDKISGKHNTAAETPRNVTALHFAAASRASDDAGRIVLTQLLDLNPDAARIVDSEGSTPLHRIAENKHKVNWDADGVHDLYDANTEAIQQADLNGRLPLHRAAIGITYHNLMSEESTVAHSKICQLLARYEDGAHHADNFGCLPVHLVAQYGKGWDAQAQALHDANPAAVRSRTGVKYGNRLPLHMAAANPNAEFSLISKLLELNPRGAAQADRKGMYPLHIACETGLNWRCIQAIHEAYPEGVQQVEQNSRGWTALHMAAAAKDIESDVIENLVDLNPGAAAVADSNGDYPLHLACRVGKTWETGLSKIFDANADAIRCPDSKGLLPLHITSFLYSAESNAKPTGPQVIDIRSRRMSKSAFAVDAEQATTKEREEARKLGNIFNLIKADPTVLF